MPRRARARRRARRRGSRSRRAATCRPCRRARSAPDRGCAGPEAGRRACDSPISPVTLRDRPADAEAAEAAPAVAQLAGLVRPGRAAGGHVGRPGHAAVEHDVDLHGRQAAAVEHLAGADGDDGAVAAELGSLTELPPRGLCPRRLRGRCSSCGPRRSGGGGRACPPGPGRRRRSLASSSVCSAATSRWALVMRAELGHAELDLRLDGAVGAAQPRALGGVDDRPVKLHVRLDDVTPGGAVGDRGELVDRLAGAVGHAPRRDHDSHGLGLERDAQPEGVDDVAGSPASSPERRGGARGGACPREISTWVAARKEWRAIPRRSANSASRRRLPGSSSPSRISSRSTLAAASTVETVFRCRLRASLGRPLVASMCCIIPQLDNLRSALSRLSACTRCGLRAEIACE